MVSTTGFYNTARNKADHLGIRCLDIEEIDNFDWLLAPGIHATTKRLLSNEWTFFPVTNDVVEGKDFEIIDLEGRKLTPAVLTANAQKQLTQLLQEITEPVEETELTVRFPGEGLLLRNTRSAETVPVNYAIAKIRYSIDRELVPFRLVQYQANKGEENITDAAYTDIKVGDREARLIIVYKEEEGGKVVLIPKAD